MVSSQTGGYLKMVFLGKWHYTTGCWVIFGPCTPKKSMISSAVYSNYHGKMMRTHWSHWITWGSKLTELSWLQTAKNFSERQQSITERQEQIWEAPGKKSQLWIGKSSINGICSIAVLVYQMVSGTVSGTIPGTTKTQHYFSSIWRCLESRTMSFLIFTNVLIHTHSMARLFHNWRGSETMTKLPMWFVFQKHLGGLD